MLCHTIYTCERVHDDDFDYALTMQFDWEVPFHIDHIFVHFLNGSI